MRRNSFYTASNMDAPIRGFPFRWVLPTAQFLFCCVLLWPARHWFVFEVNESIQAYKPPKTQFYSTDNTVQVLNLPWSAEDEQRAANAEKVREQRMRVPVVLDFPVLMAQMPYVILAPAKREWVPRDMLPETWRALSWPFAGIIFWVLAGRGIEAVRGARRSVFYPRMGKIETVIAALLFCVGVVGVIGISTSTSADRSDMQFMALLAGTWLWGALATVTLVARLLQWRMKKSVVHPETAPFPE